MEQKIRIIKGGNPLSAFWLKLIAAATMLIDHVGLLFFPQLAIFRMIGRISFPLYAFLAAEGAANTRHKTRYLARLFLFAMLSELPFRLAFSVSWKEWTPQNVMFTLLAGVASCFACTNLKKWQAVLCTAALAALAQLCGSDYGAYGVLTVVLFYVLRAEKAGQGISFSLLTVLHTARTGAMLQTFSVFALVPCAFYNGTRGRDLRWFFYAFYPAHLLVLWGIHIMLLQ